MKIDKFLNQLVESSGKRGSLSLCNPVELPNGKILKGRTFRADYSSLEEMRENFLKIRNFLLSYGFIQNCHCFIPQPQSYYLNFSSHSELFYHVGDPCPFGHELTFSIEIQLFFEDEEVKEC